MIRPLLCAALFLAAAPAALAQSTLGEVVVRAPAPNAPGVEVKSEAVKVSDLNLRRPNDTNVLYKRISIAADRVCSPRPVNPAVVSDSADHKKCVDAAIASAVKAVKDPHLTRRWQASKKG